MITSVMNRGRGGSWCCYGPASERGGWRRGHWLYIKNDSVLVKQNEMRWRGYCDIYIYFSLVYLM